MSSVQIVPFGSNARETAVLLLAACDDLGVDQAVVRTNGNAEFLAPDEVVQAAGLSGVDVEVEEEPEQPDTVATDPVEPTTSTPDTPVAQTEVQDVEPAPAVLSENSEPVPSATPDAELAQADEVVVEEPQPTKPRRGRQSTQPAAPQE